MASPGDHAAPRLRVFCSYAHEDQRYLEKLRVHLDGLCRSKVIEVWDDRVIKGGEDWEHEIHSSLSNADIVILLVSGDFIYSDYCYHKEFQIALDRRHDGAQLIPLLLDAYDLEATQFSNIQMMPMKNGKLTPVSRWRPQSEAFVLVSKLIREYAKSYQDAKLWNVKDLDHGMVLNEDFLEEMHSHLTTYPGVPIVVTGTGGLGKSTIVSAYARRFSREYDQVFWLTADNEARLSQDCSQMARKVGVPATDQEAARSTVRRWLEANDRWLIILDNVVDMDAFNQIVPRQSRGHVVMTSRETGIWKDSATELPLPRMSLDDCVNIVLRVVQKADRDEVEKLCNLKERVPLTIRQAADEILNRRISIAEYIDLTVSAGRQQA